MYVEKGLVKGGRRKGKIRTWKSLEVVELGAVGRELMKLEWQWYANYGIYSGAASYGAARDTVSCDVPKLRGYGESGIMCTKGIITFLYV